MILDMLTLFSLTLVHFEIIFPVTLLFFSSGYLGLKGLIFFGEPMSMIELVIGFYILLVALFNFSTFIYWIIFVWFLYKLIFTFFS